MDTSVLTEEELAILSPAHELHERLVFANKLSQAIANHYGYTIPTLVVFGVAGG